MVAAEPVECADDAEPDELPFGGRHHVVDGGAEQLGQLRGPGAEPGVAGLLRTVEAGAESGAVVGEIESTKSVGELFAPVDGEVVESNQAVVDDPSLVNADALGAWLIKVRFTTLPTLLSADEYAALTNE